MPVCVDTHVTEGEVSISGGFIASAKHGFIMFIMFKTSYSLSEHISVFPSSSS